MKDQFEFVYDLCIIGGGPAGLITALEFTRLNPQKKVLLLEYGVDTKLVKNKLDDSIIIENKVNHHDPYECTNKGLGGSTSTWGGRCVMYDKVDFIDRPILRGNCTWNTDLLDEVTKFLGITANYFECGDPIFDTRNLSQFKDKNISQNFFNGIVTDFKLERWSMPTRFGERYVKEISERHNLTVLTGYEARGFSAPNNCGEVSMLEIRKVGIEAQQFVKAKNFVLAAGAQETTRFLLRNKQLFSQLDEPPRTLGKFYQSHLSGKIATVKFTGDAEKTNYGFLIDNDGVYLRRRFQFSTEFLVDNNLLNTAIWLDNPLYYDPKHRSGAMSIMYLAMLIPFLGKRLAPPAILQSITKGRIYKIHRHILNIIRGLPLSLIVPLSIFYKRYLLKRKLPGVFLFSPNNQYALHFHSEQIPDSSNMMELDVDGETLKIHYSLLDDDINSVIELHKIIDKWLRQTGAGELQYWYPESDLKKAILAMSRDGIHQSGTIRISDSSEKGVVDKHLKIWGTTNVFVCSSAVFPTSSQANPTFFLGAFAVRLAAYLTKNI